MTLLPCLKSVCANLQYLSPPRKQGPRWRVLELRFLQEPG
jgi:hypothetical protein